MESIGRYIIYGREIGENGTFHLQGYLELRSTQRMTAIKKFLPRAHLETRKGTREQAREYCQKDGSCVEMGSWEAGGQGSRNDLRPVMAAIKQGTKTLDVIESNPNAYARYTKFFEKYQGLIEKETTQAFRDVHVEVHVGAAGCGKTRHAHETHPGLFTVNCEDSFPFDGYDGEDTILLDDFEGTIRYHQLLRVLDGHQYRCNVKGGHRYAKWTTVIITSNTKPEYWYRIGLTDALARRFKRVTVWCDEEGGNTDPLLSDL